MTTMTLEEIKKVAPSVLSTSPSPKVSSKYVFVPTMDIIENFEKVGWDLASVKQSGKDQYGLHELRFRNGELPKVGDCFIESVIRNSHNGLATLSVSSGLHRLLCKNGLSVPTSVNNKFELRHMGFDVGEVKRLTDSFAERLPLIQNSVDRMVDRELNDGEKIIFVKRSMDMRLLNGLKNNEIDIEDILQPKRDGDVGNSLWKVFNILQEKFVRGGIEYRNDNGRRIGLRGLNNIGSINYVNTRLWEIAEEMI
jgi:hypothetical protein